MIYYKLKVKNNHWFILFEKDNVKTFIYNDVEQLSSYISSNKNELFISGDNYYKDNYNIASILKNGIPYSDVSYEDLKRLLPISLDVTQEILRSNPVKLDTCMLNLDKKVFNYDVNEVLTKDDLEKVLEELIYTINFIKELYSNRKDYFDWRLGLIKEFNLPIECVTHSKNRLMEDIVSFNGNRIKGIRIDPNLQKYIDKMPDLKELLNNLITNGLNSNTINFGSTTLSINNQGIKSGRDKVIDTSGENNYLYIDFNSFGPSMIINNNWLDKISKYPERYELLRNRRIDLKKKNDPIQKYYKRLINSFIDSFNIEESIGYNPDIYKSITINGIMIMYLVYKEIKKYVDDIIEVNTDGMIIKCDSKDNIIIRQIVQELCNNLNMSCDVDTIIKIVHRNTQSYCIEFEDESIKKIGVFGKMEDERICFNSKRYLSIYLLDYYLKNEYNIMKKIQELIALKDPSIFQEIISKSSKIGPLYMKENGKYIELTSESNRLIVVKDKSRNPVFKKNESGEYVPYNSKVNYELVNDGLSDFDISRLDIDYYFGQVKRNIEMTSGKKIAMLDIDGTLIKEQDKELILRNTLKKLKIIVAEDKIKDLLINLNWAFLNFISQCKKQKGYGTISNYVEFCKEKCKDILGDIDYDKFVKTYISEEQKNLRKGITIYDGVIDGIKNLRYQGYNISIYTNGLAEVQKTKLKLIPMSGKIIHFGDLSNSFAKSSKKGFLDQIRELNLDLTIDTLIMVGNGTSDLPPKTLNISAYILLNGRDKKGLAKSIINREKDNVTIVDNLEDVPKILTKKAIKKNIK